MSKNLEFRPATTSEAGTLIERLRNRNPFQSSYWALFTTIDDTESRCLLALGLVSAIAAGIPLPLIAVVFKGIVESFPPEQSSLDHAIFQIVGIAFAYFAVTFTWSIVWGELGRRISQRLQNRLVEKVLGLDQAFFDVDPVDINGMLVSDTQTIQRGTSEKVGLFIQSCSYFIATFVTGFILNAALTGVLFAAIVPVIILITWTGSSLISKYSLKASELTDKAALVAEGAISCVLVVQAYGVADILSDKHAQLLKSATHYAVRKVVVGALMLALIYWACYSLNALAFYWGSRLGGSSGTIYAVVFLVLDASFVFNQIGPFIQTIALAAGASSKVFTLLNRSESDIHVYSDNGIQLSYQNLSHDVSFENVDFCYPVRPTLQVLNSLNLVIPGGKSTAIVGLSGSGKSTLVGLILRLYDPNQGQVKIGQHSLKDLHLTTFRSHMAVVQQNPVIFSGTILDNIRCGIVDASDLTEADVYSRCVQAASDAHCDFVEKLQDGMSTLVSSSQGLSGGQRQRICLARALVRKPALLILDEPTSALDSWSEQKIEESLYKLRNETNTTIITIAHRLATIKEYANIIVMGDGQVLEQGQHQELIDNGIHYKALVGAQQLEQVIEQNVDAQDHGMNRPFDSTPIMSSADTSLEKIPSQRSCKNFNHIHDDDDDDDDDDEEEEVEEGAHKFDVSGFELLRRCYQYLRPERGLLAVGMTSAIVQGAVVVGEAIVFGHLVSILNTAPDRATLYSRVDFFCLMFFVISLIAFTAATLNGICFGFVAEAFVLRMRDILLRTVLVQDQSWFQKPNHTANKLMAGINQNSNAIAAVSGPILQTLFATSSMIICGMVLALVSTPIVTALMLTYIPAVLLSGYVRVKMLNRFNERYALANKNAAAIATEAVKNIKSVAAFGLEEDLQRKYDSALRKDYWNNFVVMAIGNTALSFSYSVIFFLYPLLYWWGSKQVRDGRYTQQQFFMTLPAIVIASQQCGQFFTMAPEVTAARTAARQVFRLLNNVPRITNDTQSSSADAALEREKEVIVPVVPLSSKAVLREKQEEEDDANAEDVSNTSEADTIRALASGADVEFRNITFAYPTRPDTKILKGVNIRIAAGQFVAFVGPSGAGKSSLVALLERFFDPTSGQVLVDGQDIRWIPIDEHRSKIGLVPQEPELFAGSVSFNISLGARTGVTVTSEEIEDVCKACGIHDFISSLPDGYATECGGQGSKLSGGQKQRIAVARALIRNPRILLLDEATASLDSHSEKEIQEAVATASSNRTTIVVAHRLATIQHADRIFVFDHGMLVDQGTHAELTQREGIYSSMVQAQTLG